MAFAAVLCLIGPIQIAEMSTSESTRHEYTLDDQATDINTIGAFLALRDVPDLCADIVKVDLIVLAGNGLPCTAHIAAEAIRGGVAPELLITGGIGHSTPRLFSALQQVPKLAPWGVEVANLSEAEVFCKIVTNICHVANESVILETQSTNCGENASKTLELLAHLGKHPAKVLLIQDPSMQLRTKATFQKHLKLRGETGLEILSFAPFVPVVEVDTLPNGEGFRYSRDLLAMQPLWPMEEYIGLVMGEVPRLHDTEQGYGPKGKGYIDHVDIPAPVLDAHRRLATKFEARR